MKKNDLISGKHVVELRNGERRLFLEGTFVNNSNWNTIGAYHNNLENCHVDELDVVKIFEITNFLCTFQGLLKHIDLKLIPNKSELSNIEKIILENLDRKYEWIARDKNGELRAYIDNPDKTFDTWSFGKSHITLPFPDLFRMIQWEDNEPALIADLLQASIQ